MTRRRIPGPPGDRADVHRIVQDEAMLTRLARGLPVGSAHGDRPEDLPATPVEALLADWRERTVTRELPAPPLRKAIARAARAAGLSAPARSNSSRAAVGIVASVAFLLSSTAIAGARSAQPGDVLWPVTRTFWADRADATMARHDVDVALGRATAALAAGDREGAARAMIAAAAGLPRIPSAARGALLERMQQLGAGIAAEPAVQAAGPAGLPQTVAGPGARPGVPVGPVPPATADAMPVQVTDAGSGTVTPDGEVDPSGSVTSVTAMGSPDTGGTGAEGPGTATPGQGGTGTGSPTDPAAPSVIGSSSGTGSATGTPDRPTPSAAGSATSDPAIPAVSAGSTPQSSTVADPTAVPVTAVPPTASPAPTTAPSTPVTAGSTSTPSTGTSGPSSTSSSGTTTGSSPGRPSTSAPSTGTPGTSTPGTSTPGTSTPGPSSTGSVSSDGPPTTTPSRRTTQAPPGLAPPPVTSPATSTSATSARATNTSATSTTATVPR